VLVTVENEQVEPAEVFTFSGTSSWKRSAIRSPQKHAGRPARIQKGSPAGGIPIRMFKRLAS
jgi:hypothetical protein